MNTLDFLRIRSFELLTDWVFSDCGDGDGVLVCSNHKSFNYIIELFDVWRKDVRGLNQFYKEKLDEETILYSDRSNENITISCNNSHSYNGQYMIRIW